MHDVALEIRRGSLTRLRSCNAPRMELAWVPPVIGRLPPVWPLGRVGSMVRVTHKSHLLALVSYIGVSRPLPEPSSHQTPSPLSIRHLVPLVTIHG